MEKLENVKVTYIVYRGDDGEYAVVRGFVDNQDICLAGGLYPVNEGTTIDVIGEWTKHPKYGVQFKVHSYVECRPTDLRGIEAYLSSGLIYGIGPVTAKSIVNYFGTAALDILDNDPDRLLEVPGIGPERVGQIKAAWGEQKNLRDVILYLSAFGLSTTLILRIFKRYRHETIQMIEENPYCLADDIDGIGFQTADAIALAMGMEKTNYKRCRSGILYYLSTISANGHCYVTRSNVLLGTSKLLSLPVDLLDRAMHHMEKAGDIIVEDEVRVFPKLYYDYEIDVAEDILRIMNTPRDYDIQLWDASEFEVEYTENQLDAIRGCCKDNKFVVITGEPGSGKTTTLKGIVETFVMSGKSVLLASPTGRAAKVLSEATGHEAMTIHRLLDYNPSYGFGFNADVPLAGDVLVVDEVSMVDIVLFRHLLKAVPDDMVVILVGDVNQIPSVGPGNVLADIISSGVVPVYCLNQIFRQGEGSSIRLAAHNINQGIVPDLTNPAGTDFYFLRNLDEKQVAEMIVKLRVHSLPKSKGVDAINDIHVIAPMYKGEAGVTKLNQVLQKALNNTTDCVKSGATEFRVGDKVIQTRNDYEKDVYNGSIGIITSIDTENRSIKVDFGTHIPIEYSSLELGDLDLGYATTIHKAQGSEYPIVIIPLVQTHANMWYRKLLNTAVTRAKSMVILIGSENVLCTAIANVKAAERNTRLGVRLQSLCAKE